MRKRVVGDPDDDKDDDDDDDDDEGVVTVEGCEGIDEEEGTSDSDDNSVEGRRVTVALKEEAIEEAVEGGVETESLGLEDFADHQSGEQKREGELQDLTKVQ